MDKNTPVSFKNVEITGGFWKNRQDINRNVTAQAVYDRFSDTHRFEALQCKWKPDMPNRPHIFWDSDVAKWLEGTAYLLQQKHDAHLERLCEAAIDAIEKNQDELGYFNSHFLVTRQDERFLHRNDHELYCAGHLMEAACAYYEATGKDRFLSIMKRYADYIYDVFYIYQTAAFTTCGHPEIELALIRLYETTGIQKYLELARFFLQKKGNNTKDTPIFKNQSLRETQDHLPLKEQRTAEGHAVRALYTYTAMAGMAAQDRDEEYLDACKAIFDNIVNRRMYITGGLGSTNVGESFSRDFDLPNQTAYAETCAAIAMSLFCRRMQQSVVDSRYADAIERVLYNGAISGVSLDGKAFFYENPLESDPTVPNFTPATGTPVHRAILERVEVFSCSCCPPNLLRFVASVGDCFYTHNEETLFVHQFAQSTANIHGAVVTQGTDYPVNGSIHLKVEGGDFRKLAIRIPGWCRDYTLSIPHEIRNGYAYLDIPADGNVDVVFQMPVELMESNPMVQENSGRVAVMRGPVVYCLESTDNGTLLRSIRLPYDAEFTQNANAQYAVPTLHTTGYKKPESDALYSFARDNAVPTPLTFIPYFAYANRGPAEMTVWVPVR